MTLSLHALLYTVPVLVALLAEITIRQLAFACIIAAVIGFAMREAWNYWNKP